MTGKAVVEHSDPIYFAADNRPIDNNYTLGYSPIEVATTVTFVSALVQVSSQCELFKCCYSYTYKLRSPKVLPLLE